MFFKILCLILAIGFTNIIDGQRHRDVATTASTALSRNRQNKLRCTRRFTPGNCATPVVPVWTFDYQLQNCSERLGCETTTYSNRFRSYSSCKSRCQFVTDIYTFILSVQGNGTLENDGKERKEYTATYDDPQTAPTLHSPETEDKEELGNQPLVYRTPGSLEDMEILRHVTVADIDYELHARNDPGEDDPLHPPLY